MIKTLQSSVSNQTADAW